MGMRSRSAEHDRASGVGRRRARHPLDAWRRHFDVHTPGLLAYEGESLHRRIDQGQAIDIDYLVGKLHRYIDEFVQTSPCHLVANSLGGKVAVEFAVRHPELVNRLVLLCPSGLSDEERLPVVDGVRRNDVRSLVNSVFHDPRRADRGLLDLEKQLELLRLSLRRLPATKRTLLELFYIKDHSIREIAASQNRSISAVKMELARARNNGSTLS